MARLTREKDEYECRIGTCCAEDWLDKHTDGIVSDLICEDCPFMEYVNKLARLEDIMYNSEE